MEPTKTGFQKIKDIQKPKTIIVDISEEKLLEASKVFSRNIPHEWEPSRREYLEAIRLSLDILKVD